MSKEESSPSLHPAKPPRFFSVILSQTLQNGTLEIPSGFVQEHGNCLSGYACLRVPTGSMWKVGLRRVKGRVWLHKGWKEFVEYFSVKCGYFLVFRHENGSLFHVIIFDTTMMEIEYPVPLVDLVPSGFNEVKREGNDDDDVSIGILDECPGKSSKIRALQLVYQSNGDQLAEERGHIAGSGSARGKVLQKGVNRAASDAKIRVLQRAKEFKSKNPHFIACIIKSLTSNAHHMKIPSPHFREYLKDRKGKSMIVLRDGSSGRTWDVPYYVTKSDTNRGTLGSAWRGFMLDNRLQLGDVCIFEMINRRAKTYKVTILRVAEYL